MKGANNGKSTKQMKTQDKSDLIQKKNNNLKLVRSRYILKKIFSFLDEKKKLIVIKYNKLYIKTFGITIEQYKKLSGGIKIDGINGYGKEYELETLNLIFKGFYLNEKKSKRKRI